MVDFEEGVVPLKFYSFSWICEYDMMTADVSYQATLNSV